MSDPQAILDALQAAVDARDVARLEALFGEGAVLIGAAGDGRDAEGLRRYLEGVATQPGLLRWDWQEIVPFHETPDVLGFAAFGEVVLSEPGGQFRAPIRLTIVAAREADGWRIRNFHGSIPSVS